jgi:hypothetical protein
MKEFVLLFRMDALPEVKFSEDEAIARMTKWEKWMDGLIEKNILAGRGNRLEEEGATVKPGNVVINGPYTETKEIIGGYIIIRAGSLNEAIEIVKTCPAIIDGWISAEIRGVFPPPPPNA